MKNTVFKIALFCLTLPFSAHAQSTFEEDPHHCLLEERSFSGGLGIPYSFEFQLPAAQGRLYYNASERLCFGPEVSYLNDGSARVVDVDLVVHYIFETHWLGLYPVAGVNFTSENANHHSPEQSLGMVLGAGAHRNVGRYTIFAEYTRIHGRISDQFTSVGVLYRFAL